MKIEVEDKKVNATVDMVKILMAVLVVGIHTEPLGFNIWLDYGFGIVTRFCVPFFFVANGYFFWTKSRKATTYIKRLLTLYFVWSLIYLPFDIPVLKEVSIQKILKRYLWDGNDHALWYLLGSITGFLIVFILMKIISEKSVFFISVVFLLIGCLKSTWSPMVKQFVSIEIHNYMGIRNGLFYAFPYIALGMIIARVDICDRNESIGESIRRWGIGIILSVGFLIAESILFVIYFHTDSRILWFSVLPCSYYFFMLVKSLEIAIPNRISFFIRKVSTLI